MSSGKDHAMNPTMKLPRDAVGHPDQLASAVASVVSDGPATGCRAIDLRVWDGIDLRLLPDRGLDAGAAWFGGVPLAWISPVGETAPVRNAHGLDWLRGFGGGLVTTCGLRNVGAPSEGHGQHGELREQRATVEAVERGEDGVLTVRGRVAEADCLRFSLELSRTWRTRVGEGRVELVDVVRNHGRRAEPAPMLYHVNLGAPLWGEGAELVLDSRAVRPRDDDAAPYADAWSQWPGVVDAPERVFEHDVAPGPDGWAQASVRNVRLGLEVSLRWDAATMPRFWQWVHPAPGVAVLGLEPANCSVLGRAHDRASGRLPELQPGEERVTRLEIRATRTAT
jgi:hypothetical protein